MVRVMQVKNGIPIFQEKTFTYEDIVMLSDVETKEYSQLEKILASIRRYGAVLSVEQIVDLMEFKEQSEYYLWNMKQDLEKNTGIKPGIVHDNFDYLNQIQEVELDKENTNFYTMVLSEIAWCVASEIKLVESILNHIQAHDVQEVALVDSNGEYCGTKVGE